MESKLTEEDGGEHCSSDRFCSDHVSNDVTTQLSVTPPSQSCASTSPQLPTIPDVDIDESRTCERRENNQQCSPCLTQEQSEDHQKQEEKDGDSQEEQDTLKKMQASPEKRLQRQEEHLQLQEKQEEHHNHQETRQTDSDELSTKGYDEKQNDMREQRRKECGEVVCNIADSGVCSNLRLQLEVSSIKPGAKEVEATANEHTEDSACNSVEKGKGGASGCHPERTDNSANCVDDEAARCGVVEDEKSGRGIFGSVGDGEAARGTHGVVRDYEAAEGVPVAIVDAESPRGGSSMVDDEAAGSALGLVDVRLDEGSAASTPDCQSLDGGSCCDGSSHSDSSCHVQIQQLQSRLQSLTLTLNDRSQQLYTSEQQLQLSKQAENSCLKQLQQLKIHCDASARDRDRAVLRFAEREKDLTKLQRDLAASDKRKSELARERDLLTNKLTGLAQDSAKLRRALDIKYQEMKQFSKEIDARKEQISSRDIKIQWLQNKLSQESSVLKETQLRMDDMRNQLKLSQSALYDLQQQQQQQQDEVAEGEVSEPTTDQQAAIKAHGDFTCEECESQLESLRHTVTSLQSQLDDVTPRADSADRLSEELETERRLTTQLRDQMEESREEVTDCRGRLEVMSEKHAEMLQYTMKMTDKNVELQVTASSLTAQRDTALSECESLSCQLSASQNRVQQLSEQLQSLEQRSAAEEQLLKQQLKQLEEKCQQLGRLYDDEKNNVAILNKRHQIMLKERAATMARLRQKRDAPVPEQQQPPTSSSSSDRPSSLTLQNGHRASNGSCPRKELEEEDGESLARLRRQRGRLKLRVAELVEQNDQLVEEVRRKSQLLNSYILREQTGALSSRGMDRSKADMMRMGGIMASVYGSEQKDETMTLELSLEITRKLQAVLEDTLLKNITLKENLNILGQEIDRLNAENKSLKTQVA